MDKLNFKLCVLLAHGQLVINQTELYSRGSAWTGAWTRYSWNTFLCSNAHTVDEWEQLTQVSQWQIMPDQLDLRTMAEQGMWCTSANLLTVWTGGHLDRWKTPWKVGLEEQWLKCHNLCWEASSEEGIALRLVLCNTFISDLEKVTQSLSSGLLMTAN